MILDARVYSMIVEHDRDRGTPIIEVIDQTIIEQNWIMI